MSKLVSVVVPVYKAGKYIEQCARSLFEQTYEKIEYFFVNDCTPDDSIEILQKVIDRYPERKKAIEILNFTENKGHAIARNAALRLCKGSYIIQIDSDDWIDHSMIEKMYERAESEKADIVCCGYISEKQEKEEPVYYPFEDDGKHRIKEFYLNLLYSAHWNKLIKRELIADNDIYCIEGLNNWVDIGQTLRLRFVARKIIILKEALYHYNEKNINSQSANISIKRIEDIIKTADILARFLESNGGKEYEVVANYLRFWSKSGYLVGKCQDFTRWAAIYPESNKFIFQYPYSFINKVFYFFAAKRMYGLFLFGKRIQKLIGK